jgi:hypothetical protein
MTQAISSKFPGLLEHEIQVWQALIAGDAHLDRDLLLPDFTGVYPSGITGRAGHVGQLADGPSIKDFKLHEIHAFAVGTDHAMLCYRAEYQRVGASCEETMYVSSLWQRAGPDWRNLFSQDTPVEICNPSEPGH